MSPIPSEAGRQTAQDVAALVSERLGALLSMLSEWVAHDTPTGEHDLLSAFVGLLDAELDAAGFAVRSFDGDGGRIAWGRLDGPGEGRLVLLGHHDTVYPVGTAAERQMSRRGDRILGPGVADMKGGLLLGIATLAALADLGRRHGQVDFVSLPDEESRDGPPACLQIVADADAVLCLECGRDDGAIVLERPAGRWLRVTAHGRAAHAGVAPQVGRNAATALASLAGQVRVLAERESVATLNVTSLVADGPVNVIPAEGRMTIDMRAPTDADADRLEAAVTDACRLMSRDVVLRCDPIESTPPLVPSAESVRMAETATALGSSLGDSFRAVSTGGVSDACWTSSWGVPTLDGLGPVGGGDHSPDEYILASSIPIRCGVLGGLITSLSEHVSANDGHARGRVPR
jgi:glutamate carboxypeptidase